MLDRRNAGIRRKFWPIRLGQASLIVALSVSIINLGYLCDGTGIPLGEHQFVSKPLAGDRQDITQPGNRFRNSSLAGMPVLLPADYISGIDLQRRDFESGWRSFLAGEWRDHGWWYYYLYAIGIKTPLGVLVLAGWGLALTLIRHRASAPLAEELCLWIPCAAILAFVGSQTGMNSHSRYILPALPFAVVATSKVGYFLARHWAAVLLIGMFLWATVSTYSTFPHTLSYFNELAGGPDRGYEYLIDSNIDWGQDLLLLKEWVEHHPDERPMYIGYKNLVDYRHAGFELAPAPEDPPPRVSSDGEWQKFGPRQGIFAIDVFGFTEGEYRWARMFNPFAKVGYTIFIYRITREQAAEARAQIGLPPLNEN